MSFYDGVFSGSAGVAGSGPSFTPPNGVLYGVGGTASGLVYGAPQNGQVLSVVAGALTWTTPVVFTPPTGILYAAGGTASGVTYTAGDNGKVLGIAAGVPTLVTPAVFTPPPGVLYGNGGTASGLTYGTPQNGQVLSVASGLLAWVTPAAAASATYGGDLGGLDGAQVVTRLTGVAGNGTLTLGTSLGLIDGSGATAGIARTREYARRAVMTLAAVSVLEFPCAASVSADFKILIYNSSGTQRRRIDAARHIGGGATPTMLAVVGIADNTDNSNPYGGGGIAATIVFDVYYTGTEYRGRVQVTAASGLICSITASVVDA